MTTARDPQRHPGAYAVTTHTAERATRDAPHAPRRPAAEYSRGMNRIPYTVMHDTLTHPPTGLYRVYIGPYQIGAQISLPDADDCRRMENVPPPVLFAPTHKLTKTDRRALGLQTPSEKAERAVKSHAYYKARKARA